MGVYGAFSSESERAVCTNLFSERCQIPLLHADAHFNPFCTLRNSWKKAVVCVNKNDQFYFTVFNHHLRIVQPSSSDSDRCEGTYIRWRGVGATKRSGRAIDRNSREGCGGERGKLVRGASTLMPN